MSRRAGGVTAPLRAVLLAGSLLAVPLLAGCGGLPLPSGVQQPGPVTADRAVAGEVQVLPPGPRDEDPPVEVVDGFLRAQSNPDDDHAIARQFLAAGVEWDDSAGVAVIDPATLEVRADPSDPASVTVTAVRRATIGPDGAFSLEQGGPVVERFRLERDGLGRWRIAELADGLLLSAADVQRSFRAFDVYFLRDDLPGGTPAPRSGQVDLVADRVFLPATDDPAPALVGALLRGPSASLQGAVSSALPADTELAAPVEQSAGIVTVDLGPQVSALPGPERARLSAQLVWTLRQGMGEDFLGLRLRSQGEPFDVPGVRGVQERSAWNAFDPDRPSAQEAGFVRDRALRALDGRLPLGPAAATALPVDEAAASPLDGRLALLTEVPEGVALRVGSATGPFGDPLLLRPGLTSPSWGSGRDGLWLLEGTTGQVLRVPVPELGGATPAPPPGPVETVPVAGVDGPVAAVRVSRDGARAALVVGAGAGRALWVGRVEAGPDGQVRIAGARRVAPGLTDVTDVAWETSTSLVVLARSRGSGVAPFRVSVDGSVEEPLRLGGLSGRPVGLAGSAGRPLVVSTVDEQDRQLLFRDSGGLFREEGPGSAPFYPG